MNKEMEKRIQQMLYRMTKEEVLDVLDNMETSEMFFAED